MHPFVVYTSNHFHRRDRSRFQRKKTTKPIQCRSIPWIPQYYFHFNSIYLWLSFNEKKKNLSLLILFSENVRVCVFVYVCVCVTQLTIYFNQYLSHSINNKFSIFFSFAIFTFLSITTLKHLFCLRLVSWHYVFLLFHLPIRRIH